MSNRGLSSNVSEVRSLSILLKSTPASRTRTTAQSNAGLSHQTPVVEIPKPLGPASSGTRHLPAAPIQVFPVTRNVITGYGSKSSADRSLMRNLHWLGISRSSE